MTKTVVVRYETRPDSGEENQRLIKQVFAQLHQERPDGLRYMVFRLADGAGFVHVASVENEENPLPGLAAFTEFQQGIGERLAGPPVRSEATVVGSYGFQEP